MNISKASLTAGLSVKTVRYYADINLVKPASITNSGYRFYDDFSIRKLIFVRRARSFGFSIKECHELLDLYNNQKRSSAEVKKIASKKRNEIKKKQKELQSLYNELSLLINACQGNSRPDCPILDALIK